MNRIRNFLENRKRYGSLGVVKFYIKNLLFNEQIQFNSTKLIRFLLKDYLIVYKDIWMCIHRRIRILLTKIGLAPKISVLMSVYNSENFIEEAMDSLLGQKFRDMEILVVDDASEDSSLRILERYTKLDKRVKLFKNNENKGLTKSLNFLLEKAKGEFIARMDADDISLPERLYEEYNYLKKNRDIFLIGTGAYNINEKGIILFKSEPLTTSEEIAETLPSGNCIYHPSIMFRNEGYQYREKFIFSQDYDFYLTLLSIGKKLSNLETHLVKYRVNSSSISNKKGYLQQLFANQAKLFYQQRNSSFDNKDDYDNFDPNSLLR